MTYCKLNESVILNEATQERNEESSSIIAKDSLLRSHLIVYHSLLLKFDIENLIPIAIGTGIISV